MLIGVPAETMAGETRVAVTPETVKKPRLSMTDQYFWGNNLLNNPEEI